ncbi:glycosyltransferase [Aneurinibacillus sp. Ricciae_BoGa-3]|uniref:glycosyltransferase n=1 Tax=Aneurinibacillus sp. Ricciae_BoGa-3 TaxID=3022697 RepID=UPI0023407D96|nr:glycosyltransferase [Aneurinibacillus sp. Ricciae_BoGa-3]WCK56184.1 glycosyltransferase [Aneurinibacillus sp. Ricciae_BoGa-3]
MSNNCSEDIKILLGAPVRDRGWILPRFIKHIQNSDLTGIALDTLFIANDCVDDTIPLLKGAGFHVMEYNNLPGRTAGSVRGQYSYSHLANLRNILVEEFLKTDNEYLLSIDTDILVPPFGIQKLAKDNLDICSMLLCNQKGTIGSRAHNIMYLDKKRSTFYHIFRWNEGEVIQVDLTGAVYLIHRRVFESGVRYSNYAWGENVPEDIIFCKQAKERGFKMYCDTSLKPVHVMEAGIELIGGC